MVPVTVAKAQTQEKMGWGVTFLLLLDEQKQRALPLWFYQTDAMVGGLPVQTSLQQDLTAAALARPRTLDLLMRLLKTLGGTLEGIEIDFLQGEVLSAHVSLRDQQHRQHRASACLNEALALAVRCSSTISVGETVLERKGVVLAAYGTNLQQQLETVFHLLCNDPERLFLKKEPSNLDFTDGLRGWQFLGDPEQVDYRLDTTTIHTGKASLACNGEATRQRVYQS
jgi:bifunctional DNase/RNase